VLVVTLAGCSDPPPAREPTPEPVSGQAGQGGEPAETPAAPSGDLLEQVRAQDYLSWQRAPGYETRQTSAGPHGGAVDIYVNATVSEALTSAGLTQWPVGSVIVKDGFSGDELGLTAIMEKRAEGWIWAEYYSGDRKYDGPVSVCTSCHESGDDYVRAFRFPGPG